MSKACSVEDCEKPARGRREWCAKHIERWRRWGDPLIARPRIRPPCTVDRCGRPHEARGMCATHYRQWYVATAATREPVDRPSSYAGVACSIDGCERQANARGWCKAHYQRWTKFGDPTALLPRAQSAIDRFHRRVVRTASGCWELHGALNSSGYAWHAADGRRFLAHRWAYRTFVGPIPEGLDIDHLCRNRICCNPEHLEPVTRAENLARGRAARAAEKQASA